jgi:hypothetical protein
MQRRHLLQLGLASGTALALAGAGVALWTPGLRDGRLSAPAQDIFRAVARAVLQGSLPADPALQATALHTHLGRVQAAVNGLAPATRKELSDLLALLSTAPGRLALTGLRSGWAEASVDELGVALQAMRTAGSSTRRQVYQALRELSNAAWFAEAGNWAQLGYPGPTTV